MTVQARLRALRVDFLPPRDAGLLPEARDPAVWKRQNLDELWTRADTLAGEPDAVLPFTSFARFFNDGNRQEYEDAYFARRRRLEVFALAVLSGRGRFVGPLENVLSAVCEEFTWALPAHVAAPGPQAHSTVDLFAAETASALAEICALAGPALNPALRERVENEIESRVLGPFLSDRAPWNWESATHNWAAVCAGGVGIAALWLLGSDRLAALLERLGPAFDTYLSGFPEDGVCLEGMGYWTYGFGYFTAFAELLRERSRGEVDLLSEPALVGPLKAIAGFPRLGRLGTRDFARFSDALEYRYPPGIATRLTRRLGAPGPLPSSLAETLEFDVHARWVRHLRDVVWTQPSPEPAEPDSVAWYSASQWFIARRGAVGLAAKGGHNAEPHNHNDVGAFQLVAGEDALIDDLGAGRYDGGYFGPERYRYFVNSSRSHSVPLVDGQEQRAGRDAGTDEASFSEGTLTLSFGGAYEAPAGLVRTFSLPAEGLSPLLITDRFRFAGAGHQVVERFVTLLPARVEDGITVTGTGATLVIKPLRSPLETRIVPMLYEPHEGPQRTAYCLDFVYEVGAEAVLAFQLTIQFHAQEG